MTAVVLEPEHAHGRAGLVGAVASEWTKLWTVRSTWLNLASSVVLTALLGVQVGFSVPTRTLTWIRVRWLSKFRSVRSPSM